MMKYFALLVLSLCMAQQAFAISPEYRDDFKNTFRDSCVKGAPADLSADAKEQFKSYCGCAADVAATELTDEQAIEIGNTGAPKSLLDKMSKECADELTDDSDEE